MTDEAALLELGVAAGQNHAFGPDGGWRRPFPLEESTAVTQSAQAHIILKRDIRAHGLTRSHCDV